MIDLNLQFAGGREKARKRVRALVRLLSDQSGEAEKGRYLNDEKSRLSQQYIFATLEGEAIRELIRMDRDPQTEVPDGVPREPGAIFRIWPDFPIRAQTLKSIRTVNVNAARISFSAFGEDIVWAVIDSGIDKDHPHFRRWGNLEVKRPLRHYTFAGGKVYNLNSNKVIGGDGDIEREEVAHAVLAAIAVTREYDITSAPDTKKARSRLPFRASRYRSVPRDVDVIDSARSVSRPIPTASA